VFKIRKGQGRKGTEVEADERRVGCGDVKEGEKEDKQVSSTE